MTTPNYQFPTEDARYTSLEAMLAVALNKADLVIKTLDDAIAGQTTASAAGPVLPSYTIATLPPAAANTNRVVHCSNGNAGAPCLAVSNGANWLRIAFGAAVALV